MSLEYNEEEQKLLAEARTLRKKAQELRNARRTERANAYEAAMAAGREAKFKRDEELRAFLQPLTEAFMKSGYRVTDSKGLQKPGPVFSLARWNEFPSNPIQIYWKDGYRESGFCWE